MSLENSTIELAAAVHSARRRSDWDSVEHVGRLLGKMINLSLTLALEVQALRSRVAELEAAISDDDRH